MSTTRPKNSGGDDPQNWLELVRQQVNSLQFGAVEIVVHDSRVVQIEKTERVRLGHGEAIRAPKVTSITPVVGGVPVLPDAGSSSPSA